MSLPLPRTVSIRIGTPAAKFEVLPDDLPAIRNQQLMGFCPISGRGNAVTEFRFPDAYIAIVSAETAGCMDEILRDRCITRTEVAREGPELVPCPMKGLPNLQFSYRVALRGAQPSAASVGAEFTSKHNMFPTFAYLWCRKVGIIDNLWRTCYLLD